MLIFYSDQNIFSIHYLPIGLNPRLVFCLKICLNLGFFRPNLIISWTEGLSDGGLNSSSKVQIGSSRGLIPIKSYRITCMSRLASSAILFRPAKEK